MLSEINKAQKKNTSTAQSYSFVESKEVDIIEIKDRMEVAKEWREQGIRGMKEVD